MQALACHHTMRGEFVNHRFRVRAPGSAQFELSNKVVDCGLAECAFNSHKPHAVAAHVTKRIELNRKRGGQQAADFSRVHQKAGPAPAERPPSGYGLRGWLGSLSNAGGQDSAMPAVATNAICPRAASTINIAQR